MQKESLMLLFAMLLWAGGWSALKVLTGYVSMEVLVFWRFLLMSIAFLPILYFIKEPLHLKWSGLKFVVASSVFNLLFMVFSYFGIKSSFAGSGSVIITILSPIATFLLASAVFKKALTKRELFGLFLGLVGGVVMLKLYTLEKFSSGNIYFLLCALSWAVVTLLAQHSKEHIHPVHYSFYIAVVATIASFFVALGEPLSIVFEQDSTFWGALLFLAVFGQTVATTIFFIASGKIGSQKTSSFMFLVPLFSVVIAWAVLGEKIELEVALGGILGVLGIIFLNK